MAFADRIVAATPLDRQQMHDLYQLDEAKVCVIPCGVNLDLFQPMDRQLAREKAGVPDQRRWCCSWDGSTQ
jgi:D-inositol-3-phosphate glycosyltransferase